MCCQITIIQKILQKHKHNNIKLFSPIHSNNCLELISPIKLTKKLSDDELIIYVKNLFNNNCYDCCKQIINQIKRTNSCLFFCNDNTNDIIINKRMTDETILKIISARYPNNCNRCNEKIIHKIKEKYYCLFYCSTNPKQFKLIHKISNNQLLLMIISKYPNICKQCLVLLCDNIIKHNNCLFNCKLNNLSMDISEKISDFDIISYIKHVYPNNCDKCNKILCEQIKFDNKCIFYCIRNTHKFKLKDNNDISQKELMNKIKLTYPYNCSNCNDMILKNIIDIK